MFHVRSLLFDDRRELRYLELDRSTFHCEQCITWWNPFFAIRRLWRLWDDKWLERSWEHERSVTRREDGYFLLLSIPSTPLLSFSLLLLLLLLSLPFEMSSTRLEGNRHKAINFVVWEYRICCLPSPPPFLQRDKEVRQQFYGFIFLATDIPPTFVDRPMKMRLLNAT